MEVNPQYMARALELARHGLGNVSPNPMVGAVIVDRSGSIIGEGYHRCYGRAHAEVNAIRSVDDDAKLKDSTIYVTLEPCSHYGKTPPCAQLIIDKKIPRAVVGATDPNEKVSGRGLAMLRDAGVEVVEGVMERECMCLNAIFMTAHLLHRPFVTLKWAQSRDGFIDHKRTPSDCHAASLSTTLSRMAVHSLRSIHDAILVGSNTVLADNPMLDNRLWSGNSPRPVILDRRRRVKGDFRINERNPLILCDITAVDSVLARLFEQGVSSLLVEGGAEVLQSFIDSGLWDIMRVETSPDDFAEKGSVKAPRIYGTPSFTTAYGDNRIDLYVQNSLVDVKNL